MPKTYEIADSDVREMLDKVIEDHHPTLREAHAHVAVLLVYAPADDEGNPTSPALTVGGWPAQALVRITPLRDRALGMADAVIEIDGHRWEGLDEDEQAALLDHEAQHLVAQIAEEGETRTVKSDTCDRPVLTMRKHDVRFEGFADVMKRHGRAAPERELLEAAVAHMQQYELALPGVEVRSAADKPKRRRGAPGRAADAVRAAAEAVEDLAEEMADAVAGPVAYVGARRPSTRVQLDVVAGGSP